MRGESESGFSGHLGRLRNDIGCMIGLAGHIYLMSTFTIFGL